jgi:hypothetical protein
MSLVQYDQSKRYLLIFFLLDLVYIAYILKTLFSAQYSVLNYPLYLLLIMSSVILAPNMLYKIPQRCIFLVFATILLIMLIRGLKLGNWYVFYLSDFARFILMFFVLFMGTGNFAHKRAQEIPEVLAKWLFIGLPISIALFLIYRVNPGSLESRFVSLENQGFQIGLVPAFFVLHSVFLLPFWSYLRKASKIIVLISVLFVLTYSMLTLTRILIIAALASIVFSALLITKDAKKRLVINLIILVPAAILLIIGDGQFVSLLDQAKIRFTDSPDISTGRYTEGKLFLESLDQSELILGKGLGGAQTTWIWSDLPYGTNMVHLGFLYLIMKGGLVLSFCTYLAYFLSAVKLIRLGGIYRSYSAGIVVFVLLDIAHTQWIYPINLIFLFCSLSLAFSNSKRPYPI